MLEPPERLRNAIRQDNLPITKRLLLRFPELWLNRDSSNQGWCNLHFASYHGNYLICFHLVSFVNKKLEDLEKHYSKLDLLTFDDLTVIHLPLIHHHSQTLHYLLQEFPGELWLDYAGGEFKRTPLHYACVYGFKEGIKLLLEFGADWNAKDLNGNTCLHLCFQYGNFDCIQDLLKYILMCCIDKDEGLSVIDKFESTRNNEGWLAIDFAYSFELAKSYRFLKQELFVFNNELNETIPLASSDLNTSRSSFTLNKNPSEASFLDNKVLASPIIPMSQSQTQQENEVTGKDPQDTSAKANKNRAHSQSLPSSDPASEFILSKNKPLNIRRRSNTLYNCRPPNTININSPRNVSSGPLTPMTTQSVLNTTPSLKSITISPQVRGNGNDNPVSPQSVTSVSSNTSTSPIHLNYRRKSMNNMHVFQVMGHPNSSSDGKLRSVSSSSLDSKNTESECSQTRSRSGTPSPNKQMGEILELPKRSSPMISTAAKVASSNDKALQDQEDSTQQRSSLPTIEPIPPLRKTNSSSSVLKFTLSKPKSTPMLRDKLDSDNEGLNINSISFSRVR